MCFMAQRKHNIIFNMSILLKLQRNVENKTGHIESLKITEQRAHVFRGRLVAIIIKPSQLHLPHANWWQANRQHA